jgi:fimbrial isopeptide formation D2 family protein/LPXTG-motif cell wall-anchored protein
MKKILSIVLALAMVLMVAAASAATITINRKTGDTYTEETTYTYYQVLKAEIGTPGVVNAETGAVTGGTAAYYVDNAELKAALDTAGAADIFTIEQVANTNPVRWNYILKTGKTIDDLLPVVSADGVLAKATATGTFKRAANANTATSPELDPGYYVIKSSLGSVIAAQTLNTVTINEKNEYVTLEKDVVDPIIEIGQQAEYQLKIKIPANPADKDLLVYDHMHEGLTLVNNIKVTGTKTGADIADLTFSEDTYTQNKTEKYNYYVTTITKANVKANAGQTIILTYKAIVNEKAIVYVDEPNKAHLEYDDHSFSTPEDEEKVKTLAFKLRKIDGQTKADLTGAEFSLWTAAENGDQVALVKVEDGKYRVATAAEKNAEGFKSAIIEAGNPQIDGLDDKAYYVQEDKAPAGYNKLTARISVTPDNTAVVEHDVENNQGTELPSTGGIGTTIFYVVGGLLLVGAAIILVARRKANS